MNHDIHSLIGAYAVDAVNAQERVDFEQHLQVCADCRFELDGLRAAASRLGGSESAAPPPQLRDSILAEIDTIRPLAPIVPDSDAPGGSEEVAPRAPTSVGGHRRRVYRWLAATAAAAALVVAGIAWHPWTHPEPTRVTAIEQVLQAPDAQRYVKHLDGATATVIYSPKLGESVLTTEHMAPAPSGHTYQIWYMTASGQATSAGFIKPTEGSPRQRVLLQGNADRAATIGVTVEPTGGSSKPTTTPLMVIPLAS